MSTYKLFPISTPFTGQEMSGYDQEKGWPGRLGIMEYTSQKGFYRGTNASPLERLSVLHAISTFRAWLRKLARAQWRPLKAPGTTPGRQPAIPDPTA